MQKYEYSNPDALLSYLFDHDAHPLRDSVSAWVNESRRFNGFVSSFRDKIRKKLRVTKDEETLQDLRLELETAYLLLRERALSLVYESEHHKQVRSPDFAVSYTTSLTFMVEVTRLRATQRQSPPQPEDGADVRLVDAICSKLGQMLSQRSNVLIVGADDLTLTSNDLQAMMLRLQQRAEHEAAFWQRYGFRERGDFFQHYQRLSEILLRPSRLPPGVFVVAWVNPQARYPLPGKVRTALYRSHNILPPGS